MVKKKLYGFFLWMGFNYLKARVPKFPEIPGIHFIDLRRMKG